MTDRDRATIIAFGTNPVVERPLSTARQISPIASIVDGGKTDIAGAIRLALATLPSTMARKIVVVSDGNENTGKAIEQARVSSAAGVPIQVVPLAQQSGPEVLVRTVETPAFVREGEKFSATLTLEASQDTQARVHLLADGRLLASQNVNLTQGSNSIVMPQEPLPPGFHLFRVQVEASADTYIQNNEGGSYTVVTGQAARPDHRVRGRRDPVPGGSACGRPAWRWTSETPRRPSSTCRRCAATRAWCWRTCRPPT